MSGRRRKSSDGSILGTVGDIRSDETPDTRSVIEREPVSDTGTPVVSDHGEPLETKRLHCRHDGTGHRALRVSRVFGIVGQDAALAVTGQVASDDREMAREVRCDPMPTHVCLRVPMQQKNRRSAAADAGKHLGFGSPDPLGRKSRKRVG